MSATRLVPALIVLIAAAACGSPPADKGALEANLQLAASLESLENWPEPPADAGAPPGLREVEPGGSIWVGSLVTGFAENGHGFANLRVDLALIDPAGQVSLHQSNLGTYEQRPEPGRAAVMVLPAYVLTIAVDDPPGTYIARATVTDLVSGKTALASAEFAVRRP